MAWGNLIKAKLWQSSSWPLFICPSREEENFRKPRNGRPSFLQAAFQGHTSKDRGKSLGILILCQHYWDNIRFFLDWIFWWNVRPQPKRSEAIIQVRQISWYIFKIFWKAFESINSFGCSGDGKVLALAGWLLPSLGILSFRFGSRWMRLMATISVLDTVKITVN